MREPLPLATIQESVLEFLRGRDDAVVFGAQAVNAYVQESRMTQDIDLLSPRRRFSRRIARILERAVSYRHACAGNRRW